MTPALAISLWIIWWQHYHYLLFLFYLTIFCAAPASSATELRFTKVPLRVLYVSNGSATMFEWDYYLHSSEKHQEIEITWSRLYPDKSSLLLAFQYHASWDSFLKVYNTHYQTRLSTINNGFNTTLVVSNMTGMDSGVYRCKVLLRGEASKVQRYVVDRIQVIVTDPPQFVTTPPPVLTIAEGQNISLPCSARGPPDPNVTWVWLSKGGQVVKASGVGHALLSMRSVMRGQDGVYECRASNNPHGSPATIRTKITVQHILFPPKNTTLVVGEELRLQCIMGAEQKAMITWHRTAGAGRIRSHGCNYGNQILVIPDAKQTDAGTYTCTATILHDGKLLTVSASAHVTVRGPPRSPVVRRIPCKQSIIIEWEDNMYCADGPVTMYTIYWRVYHPCDVTSPWKLVTNVTKPTNRRYNVTSLQPEVTNQYLVTSWNKFGESAKDESRIINIRMTKDEAKPGDKGKNHVNQPPVPPSDCQTYALVTAASIFTNMILLVALIFFIFKLHRLSGLLKTSQLTTSEANYESVRSYHPGATQRHNQSLPESSSRYEILSTHPKYIEDHIEEHIEVEDDIIKDDIKDDTEDDIEDDTEDDIEDDSDDHIDGHAEDHSLASFRSSSDGWSVYSSSSEGELHEMSSFTTIKEAEEYEHLRTNAEHKV